MSGIGPFFWLVAAIAFVVLEAVTFSLVSVWFAIGAAASLISCVFTHSFRVQSVIFIAVSTVCLLAVRPLAARLRTKPAATNAERNLGRTATALTAVSASKPGRVRLDGIDWNARCATPGDTLAPGDTCRVTELHSTLLIVEPILTETVSRKGASL